MSQEEDKSTVGDLAGYGFTIAIAALCPLGSVLFSEFLFPIRWQAVEVKNENNDNNNSNLQELAIQEADQNVEIAIQHQYWTAILISLPILIIGLSCADRKGVPRSISLGFILGFLLTIVIALYNGYDSVPKIYQAAVVAVVIVALVFISQRKVQNENDSNK